MNVWSKLLTALRGGANEMGEAVVDSQALRILDQEIRDADSELRKSKEALAEIMAKHKLASDKVSKSATSIAEYEQYALKALEAGNETLAKEVTSTEEAANIFGMPTSVFPNWVDVMRVVALPATLDAAGCPGGASMVN